MKKKLLIVLSIIMALLLITLIGTSLDEPLDPAVEQALSFQIPRVAPEDNAYVGLSGLQYVNDGDLVSAGLKFLESDPKKERPPAPARDFSYKNPCLKGPGEQPDCLNQIVADAAAINEDLDKNRVIIERYRRVLSMPQFVNTGAGFEAPVPLYQAMIESSRLLGAKAMLDIKQNNPAAGFDSLEAELAFCKRMGQSEHVSLIDLMIAVAGLNMKLNELSRLIEDGQIDLGGYEEQLRKMLDLDLEAGRMMTAAISTEKRTYLHGLAHMSDDKTWLGPDAGFKDRLQTYFYLFLYKKNMTLNQLSAKLDAVIGQFKAAPLLGFPDYYHQRLSQMDEVEFGDGSHLEFKNLYNKYGLFFFKNYAGERLLEIAQPMYSKYMARINDTVAQARLVRAQLELRLLNPQAEDVPEALTKLGPETWNPYTGQPFAWDAEKKVLWIERIGSSNSSNSRLEAGLPNLRP